MQNALNELNEKRNETANLMPMQSATPLMLDAPGVAKIIATRIKNEIDEYCLRTYDGGHRKHLGASLIGRSCKRYLWYVFRWAKHTKSDGRRQRLFNRGHREEARFVEWLRGIGFQVWTHNTNEQPDANGEYPQYRMSAVMGHFGGSLDAIIKFPPHWNIDEAVLGEFKTHGTGSKFSALMEKGMMLEKQDHFAQTSTYGYKYNFRYVIYFSINKNDDDLHVEIVKLNHNLGKQMEAKAEQIIRSPNAPNRLSENPTYHECKYCDMFDICHENAAIERNCRSCQFATPVENAQWHCSVHNGIIPEDFIPQACPSYQAVN